MFSQRHTDKTKQKLPPCQCLTAPAERDTGREAVGFTQNSPHPSDRNSCQSLWKRSPRCPRLGCSVLCWPRDTGTNHRGRKHSTTPVIKESCSFPPAAHTAPGKTNTAPHYPSLLITNSSAGRGSLCSDSWQVLWLLQAGMSQLQPQRMLPGGCKGLSSAAPKTS